MGASDEKLSNWNRCVECAAKIAKDAWKDTASPAYPTRDFVQARHSKYIAEKIMKELIMQPKDAQ